MIFVQRAEKPKVLEKKERAWKNKIRAAKTKEKRESAQSKYQNPEIKAALARMFAGKCAYCESQILHIDYGHIEHFKPKSKAEFYDLAVDWDNLMLACGRCNGTENKGTKFPGIAEGGPLINPTEEDPSLHLRFDFDPLTKLANVLGISARGELTWKTLGLNRTALLHHRSNFVKKLWVIASRCDLDIEARNIIQQAVRNEEEYSAFARELMRAVDEGRFRN